MKRTLPQAKVGSVPMASTMIAGKSSKYLNSGASEENLEVPKLMTLSPKRSPGCSLASYSITSRNTTVRARIIPIPFTVVLEDFWDNRGQRQPINIDNIIQLLLVIVALVQETSTKT